MADGQTFEALGLLATKKGMSLTACLVEASGEYADTQIAEDEAFAASEKAKAEEQLEAAE